MRGTSDKAAVLAAGYSRTHRVYELIGLAVATLAWVGAAAHAVTLDEAHVGHWVGATLLAMAFADLVSGVAHWAFDTWGGVDTPVLGKLAIRTFRHHHVDPKAITEHDFVETNGHNAMLSIVLTAPVPSVVELSPFLALFLFGSGTFVAFTSQFHKWAHMNAPPRAVRVLQRLGLVLSPEAHAAHHEAPFEGAYCVTTGWMNGLLDRTRTFRALERAISALTHARPRAHE
jgi:plasmanylethanolamine desaturase